MKRGKWAAVSALVAALCPIAVACTSSDEKPHEHNYDGSQWVITTMPTETTGGVASRECVDGDHTDTVNLPNVKDTSVWTKVDDKSTPAGHGTPGTDVYTSAYGEATVTVPAQAHTYGGWQITTAPTFDTAGAAKRECTADGDVDTAVVEKLSDTSVWTKDAQSSTAPECEKKGKDVYKSVYGTVEVEVNKLGHLPTGGWTVTQEPTATAGGKSTSACARCDDTIEKILPSFADTEFWHHTHAEADYNHGTSEIYASDFGTVVKEQDDKLVAPYDGKTYFGIPIDATTKVDQEIPYSNSWNTLSLELDGKGSGVSTNFLFGTVGSRFHIRMDDYAKGLITLENTKDGVTETQAAYLDTESGIYVQTFGATPIDMHPIIMTPFETDQVRADCTKASAWSADNKRALAITYTSPASSGSKAYNIFIYNGKVYFGVKFASDKAGNNAVAAENCYNSAHLYVLKDDEQIAAFAYDGEHMVETDGYEGSYEGTLDGVTTTLEVSGHGVINATGTYFVADSDDYTIDAYIDGKYFEITLNDNGTYTAVKPMVKVTLVSSVDSDNAGLGEKEVNKNIAFVFPELTDDTDTKLFGGWFFDAGFKKPVPAGFKPTEDVTLYAKWAAKLVIHVHSGDSTQDIYVGEGVIIGDVLPQYGLDIPNNRVFRGWYRDAQCTLSFPLTAAITESENGFNVYAKWEALPAYYGEYHGYQLLSGVTDRVISLTIDEDGIISGSYKVSYGTMTVSGVVTDYDVASGRITWKNSASDTQTHYLWTDKDVVLFAVPEDVTSSDEIGTTPYLLTKGDASSINGNISFGFHNGANKDSRHCTYLVSYGTDDKLAFIYNNKVYSDVSVTDVFGASLATLDSVNNSKTVVFKDSDGNLIVKFGSTAATINGSKDELDNSAVRKPIDNYAGNYTVGGKTYTLNGIGDISWNDMGDGVSACYEFIKEEGDFYVFGVFTRTIKLTPVSGGSGSYDDEYGDGEDYGDDDDVTYEKSYVNKQYYVLKIAKDGTSAAHSIELENKTLNYNVNLPADATGADGVADESESINANIEFALDKVIDDIGNYVFDGWYETAACSGDKLTTVTIRADKTVYAKWIEKLTVTLHINYEGAEELAPVYVGKGKVAEIAEPTIENLYFLGWYTDAACTLRWNAELPVTADFELYAKWGTPAYMHTYGFITVGSSYQEKNACGVTYYDANTSTIDINAAGELTATGSYTYPFNVAGLNVGYNNNDVLIFTRSTSKYVCYIDDETGLLLINSSSGETADAKGFYFLTPFEINPAATSFSSSYWDSGRTRVIQYTHADTTYNMFVYQNKVYFGVTFTDLLGDPVDGKDAYHATSLYVKDADGKKIAGFAYNGTTMQVMDGSEGVYSGEFNGKSVSLVVTGTGFVTLDGENGTSSVNGDVLECYVGGAYYEITLNAANKTCAIVKPMVTLAFDTAHSSANAMTVNKNIGVALPMLTSENHVFRGWFVDSDFNTAATLVDGKYVPAANATLYAKWDEKVTLTVVYATTADEGIKDMPNVVLTYGAGDATALTVPPFTSGKAFEGWYTDAGLTAPYTPGTPISESMTVYCKWQTAVAMFGTYSGWNLYSTSATEKTSGFGTTYTVDPDGTVKKGSSVIGKVSNAEGYKYDKTTGIFYVEESSAKTYFVYDETSGALCVGNTRKPSDFKNYDLDLMFKKPISKVSLSALLGSKDVNDFGSGWLMTVTFTDGSSVNVFATNTRIYGGVTWEATDSSGNAATYAAKDVGNASAVTIKDSKGNVIVKRGKDGSTWKALDDYAGTYTGALGELTFNGVGGVKLSGVSASGKYTLASDQTYTADVYVDGKYYQITLDKTAETYTAVKPVAAVTFESAHSTHAVADVNINIDYTLPTVDPVEVGDYKFKGWYDNAQFTGSAITVIKPTSTEAVIVYARWIEKVDVVYNMNGHGELANDRAFPEQAFTLPTASTVTADGYIFKGWYDNPECAGTAKTSVTPKVGESVQLYAKWAEAVTLTIKNGTEVVAQEKYVAGDALNLSVLDDSGDSQFVGYFADQDLTVPFTDTAISENKTVYAKYEKVTAYTIDYGSSYAWKKVLVGNTVGYASGNQSVKSSSSTLTLTVVESGTLNIGWKVSSESGYDKYTIKVNGVATEVNEKSGVSDGVLTLNVNAGDKITFEYKKDSSGDKNDDTAYITNLAFTVA